MELVLSLVNLFYGKRTAWGQYVGNRYKSFDNIIWVIGGDTDPTLVKPKVQAFVGGLSAADSRHPITAHNGSEQMAVTPWPNETWLNVNDVYTYGGALYQSVRSAYLRTPTLPVFLIESAYENMNGATNQTLRAQSYWTVLSGGFGHVFGNCPIWGFFTVGPDFCGLGQVPEADWKVAMTSQGSLNMQHFQALFNSRHWSVLIPDTQQAVLTGGFLAGSDYATAAYASDGSSIIAYLPSARTVTVSGARLAGSTMTAWWYNPTTGVASPIGTYPTTGTQPLTPPSSGDWVLVLDSASFPFPSPGQ